jgi:hypothetical protein
MSSRLVAVRIRSDRNVVTSVALALILIEPNKTGVGEDIADLLFGKTG